MNIRKLQAIFIMTALLFGVSSASGDDYKRKLTLTIASASPVYDEAYTLTVPDNSQITKSGWTSIGDITAKYSGSNAGFDPSKKLVITVTSTNDFKLTATGANGGIGYNLATSENDTGATTTFEFAASEITAEGTSKTIGVKVDDYSNAQAGDYEDEITYNVAVQNAPITVTWNNDDITGDDDTSFTKDGVTITGQIDYQNRIFVEGTFTTTLGKFTKIEVTHNDDNVYGVGWTVSGNTATWTGNADSVPFGNIVGDQSSVTFVFTIEPQSESEGGPEGGNDGPSDPNIDGIEP